MFFTNGVFVHKLVIPASTVHLIPAGVVGENAEPVAFMVGLFETCLANVSMWVTGAIVAYKD